MREWREEIPRWWWREPIVMRKHEVVRWRSTLYVRWSSRRMMIHPRCLCVAPHMTISMMPLAIPSIVIRVLIVVFSPVLPSLPTVAVIPSLTMLPILSTAVSPPVVPPVPIPLRPIPTIPAIPTIPTIPAIPTIPTIMPVPRVPAVPIPFFAVIMVSVTVLVRRNVRSPIIRSSVV
ncbi:hypothetical protein BC936DRAFT_150182 [Jimgerdemannia flammicorona]|uniref:Uncharacterized protein n=1 Tax=Jimgerdemannia flammicorona TaxID=994334 RepID=A0A433CZE6_9FUNG|nr:hypothetical protein BC936DRAFT_150182 [Jimgerdemannia flammicorona]